MLRAVLAILALHRLALGIAAALLVVYTLVGFFWVPHLLRTNAQRYVADELGRGLAVGEVSFNPFTFRLSVRDAVLSEKGGDAIASFKQLVVNAELASIWQRAVVLKEVQLDAPGLTETLAFPEGPALVRAIIMHELAHVVGLDHVNDPTQLMHAENSGQLDFGAGDRAGLALLGTGKCVPGI